MHLYIFRKFTTPEITIFYTTLQTDRKKFRILARFFLKKKRKSILSQYLFVVIIFIFLIFLIIIIYKIII